MKILDLPVRITEAFRGAISVARATSRMERNLRNLPGTPAGPLAAWAARTTEQVNAHIDAQKAEMQVRVLCKDENDFQYVTATIPEHGETRIYALNQIAKLLVAGVSLEHTRDNWRAAELVLFARAMDRVNEVGVTASEAMRAFQQSFSKAARAADFVPGRGRNKRFAKRRPWGQA